MCFTAHSSTKLLWVEEEKWAQLSPITDCPLIIPSVLGKTQSYKNNVLLTLSGFCKLEEDGTRHIVLKWTNSANKYLIVYCLIFIPKKDFLQDIKHKDLKCFRLLNSLFSVWIFFALFGAFFEALYVWGDGDCNLANRGVIY